MFWFGFIIVGGAIMVVVLAWQLLGLIFSILGEIINDILDSFSH